uniref:Uncharacterized protein n=1 Tax=Aegilops tauschii subsp. strangulata TaxID=200361 RepID=A0A453QCA3_AEGTS
MTISECSNLVCWPTEELRCLDSLRLLYIMNCNNLEGKTSSAKEETLPLSLEALTISSCCSVVALPSNLGNLTKLKGLNVSWCNALKALPDGLCGLTSLRESQIWGCPTLKKLPQGLLERLSALKRVSIIDCPDLERRCREGGEYFHLVSPVPLKEIHH